MGFFSFIFNKRLKPNHLSVRKITDTQPKYYIRSNVNNPSRKYELLHEEEIFIDALLEKSMHLKGEYDLVRLSDGTISVSFNSYPIGKIKLQGRKKRMMYMENLYDSVSIDGELKDFIYTIDKWIKYIEKYI